MAVNAKHGSFTDLKELLSQNGGLANGNENGVPQLVKSRIHLLCSDFLGGAWKNMTADDLQLTKMCGGTSNLLFLCRLPKSRTPLGSEPDKVLLRVYFNPETESHLVAESVIFTLLSERRLGPKLYGIFNGGRFEEYIVSRPLSCQEIRVPELARKIAVKLAGVHSLSVPITKEPTYICEAMDRWVTHLLNLIGTMEPVAVKFARQPGSKTLDSMSIRCEIETIRSCLNCSKSRVLFCHNDFQEGNILLCQGADNSGEDARLVLIDFEYASYNYRGFDFANHFCEYAIDYSKESAPYYSINQDEFPTPAQQAIFCEEYLKAMGEDYSAASVDALIAEIKPFIAASHFFWGVWGLLQVECSPIHFGFWEYARERLGLYFDNKADLLTLLEQSNDSEDKMAVLKNGGDPDAVNYCRSMFRIESSKAV